MLVWNCNYSLALPIQCSFLIAIKAIEFIGYYHNLLQFQDKHLAPNFENIQRFIIIEAMRLRKLVFYNNVQ